jgi:hypothetical protein
MLALRTECGLTVCHCNKGENEMAEISSKIRVEAKFDDTENRALESWSAGQPYDTDRRDWTGDRRSPFQPADGSHPSFEAFCENPCGLHIKSSSKRVLAECVRVDCKGSLEQVQEGVRTILARTTEITDAYRTFIES